MMSEYRAKPRTGPSIKPVLAAVGASFLLGGALVGLGVYQFGDQFRGETPASSSSEESAALDLAENSSETEAAEEAGEAPVAGAQDTTQEVAQEAAEQAAQVAVERVEEQQGGLDSRLAAAEQRLARLDLQAQAAAGNVARAEGLLIAFATRRALERGAELGFLADQLRLRFGDALPNAVRTIIDFSRDPVTMDQLVARLNGLAPTLSEADSEFSWDTFTSELSQLFVVRRESTPSPQPERRLERARLFLESGRVDAAIEEVQKLPGAENAEGWLADAGRYASSQRALDLVETSAVLEPRMLRDGEGDTILQPSIAEE
ncbi:hypothetical protein ACRAQ7_10025 [Erythrobacter sp. W53]|uniref:hypothetical protein n=1 Tax=Erythrobacter sp. W53 TaxID=3425947 RepID=UPI003D768472